MKHGGIGLCLALTSLSTSFEAPRKRMLQALGCLQSTMKVKNSSPIFSTSKRPAPVPMSLSRISSALQHFQFSLIGDFLRELTKPSDFSCLQKMDILAMDDICQFKLPVKLYEHGNGAGSQ